MLKWIPLLFIGLVITATPLRADDTSECDLGDLRSLQDAFADLADSVRPSVVAIRTFRVPKNTEGQKVSVRRKENQGSGMVISSEGLILTNEHVIGTAGHIDVILSDGTRSTAEVVATDPRSDLAVLRIKVDEPLPVIRWCPLNQVRQGHWAFALGNPYGMANEDGRLAFTVGTVTALGKSLTPELDPTETRYYGNLIQTSADINPGNSGGPLFNIDGCVIGVCTATITRSSTHDGVGFAIPITDRTLNVIERLKEGQAVQYGYMGVKVSTPTKTHRFLAGAGSGDAYGALVAAVIGRDGPGAKAGLRAGDLIVQYDGQIVKDSDHFVRMVGMTPVSQVVSLVYFREGRRTEAMVKLQERPKSIMARTDSNPGVEVGTRPERYSWKGILLGEPTDKVLSANGISRAQSGLVAVDVERYSHAWNAGLRRGDVVMQYNSTRVTTLDDFRQVDSGHETVVRLTLSDNRTLRFKR